MSATDALRQARAAGIQLGIDGDELVLEASARPPSVVLDLLSRHKADIVKLLRPADDGWSSGDWQVFFDERAGIAEFDGGLTHAEAEAAALQHCVVKWLTLNPPADLGENACCRCGEFAGPDALVILAGDGNLHRVIHGRCHAPMLEARRTEALAAICAALNQAEELGP